MIFFHKLAKRYKEYYFISCRGLFFTSRSVGLSVIPSVLFFVRANAFRLLLTFLRNIEGFYNTIWTYYHKFHFSFYDFSWKLSFLTMAYGYILQNRYVD